MRRMGWVVGLVLALSSVAAFAGDGIPVGNAVFYPSVEAVYTHTDNLFLLDESMPFGKEGDSFWILRPSLGIELSLEQSFLRFNLSYQYKDYQSYDFGNHNAWFADFDSNFKFSNGAALYFRDHFIRGVQEVNQFDPGYETTFNNTPFNRNYAQLGFTLPVNKRNTFGLELGHNFVNFSNAEGTLAFYDFSQFSAEAFWKYHYSATSSVVASYTYGDSTQDHVAYGNGMSRLPVLDRDYKSNQFMIGWEGSIASRVSGSVKGGYKEMNFYNDRVGMEFNDYSGLVGKADLGFQFSEFFRGDFSLFRDAYQSAYNINNFYTASGGQFQIHHQINRYLFWDAGVLFQANNYPETAVGDVDGDGLLDSPLYLLPWTGLDRKDDISRATAEVGFHFTQQMSLRVNYQYEDRDSNVSYTDMATVYKPFSYTENRFAFQFQFGW